MPDSTGPAGALVDARVLARFEERIAADLELQPLATGAEELRRGAASLVPLAGAVSHYELLDVPVTATIEEIHEAYRDLARRVHPSLGEEIALPEAVLRVLFEHATSAYLVLSDPDRRREYDVDEDLVPPVSGASEEELKAARVAMAQRAYHRAELLLRGRKYHYVVELMRDAVRWDPRPEGFAMLAEALAKNPRRLEEAAEKLQAAIEMAPREIAYRLRLARLYEEMDRVEEAIAEYRDVVQKRPGQGDAIAALERLGATRS